MCAPTNIAVDQRMEKINHMWFVSVLSHMRPLTPVSFHTLLYAYSLLHATY